MNLRDYQLDFITYWEKVLPFGVMLWDRRSGKTLTAVQEICRLSIENNNFNSHMYFYGSLLVFARNEVVKIFHDLGQEHLIKHENAQLIRLLNGSTIRLFSIRSEKTLLGANVDAIYIDEFDFMTDRIFEEFLVYFAVSTKVKVILSVSKYDNRKMKMLQKYKGYDKYFIHKYTT